MLSQGARGSTLGRARRIIAAMTSALEPGLIGEARAVVTPELTARALGSGDVDVFGTPALLALIERAAPVCSARSPMGRRRSG